MSNLTHTDVLITGALVVGVMLGILAAELVRACQHWFNRKPKMESDYDTFGG